MSPDRGGVGRDRLTVKVRYASVLLALALMMVLAAPWSAHALADEFLKEPFSGKVENMKPEWDAKDYPWSDESKIDFAAGSDYLYFWIPMDMFSRMSISVSGGTFIGSTTGTSPFTGKVQDPDGTIDGTLSIEGTYDKGILEGTWKYTGTVSHTAAPEPGDDVTDRIEASGTIASHGPVTEDGVDGVFKGSVKAFQHHVADDFSGILGEDTPQLPGYTLTDDETDNTAFFHLNVGARSETDQTAPGEEETEAGPGAGGEEERDVSAAPPGIGGIDDLPGPDGLAETVVGILVPGFIGVFGGLLIGGGSDGGGGGAGWDEPDGSEPSDDTGIAVLDPEAEQARHILDIFDKRTDLDKNPELKELADKARETAFDADGHLIPEKWNEIKDQMRDAITRHAGEPGYDPNLPSSIIGEQIDGAVATAADVWDKTSEAASTIGGTVKKGFEGLADGIMHPGDFFRGVREGILDWNHKNTQDWREFGDKLSEAGKEGGLPAAVEVLAQGLVDSEKKLWGGLWEQGKEMLPVDEFRSLFDEKASLEEKLWAVPAAASKIAGLLVGTETGGARVPGTGDITLIPSERAAVAAAEDAAAGTRIAKPANLPGTTAKAEAGAEAASREAEKSATRLAEDLKGDKARAAAEQRFSDPAQRTAYQNEYKEYMNSAQKKADAVVDTVKGGQSPTVDQTLDTMSDPAAMRNLKTAPADARQSFIEAQNKVLEPTNRDVESFLSEKYKGEEIKVEGVRTPGKNYDPATSVNTDNDVHAVRKVIEKDGSVSWKEVPSEEWEQAYHDSFAKNSGFTTDAAKNRFPEVDWDSMTPEQQTRRWGELHQQEPGDVFSPTSARDFRKISQDPLHTGPKVDDSTHSLAKAGEGKLSDPEQLGMMEGEKFTKEWNKGTIPHQKEALEQLSKQGKEVEGLIDGYKQNYNVSDLSPKMKEALKVIEDNNLSPLERAEKIKDLGFRGGPQEISDRLKAKIGSLKLATPK